jgi:hypothetical protein
MVAVEVHVLVMGRPDLRQHLVVDLATVAAQRGDAEVVIFGRPAHDGVGGQGQAPHLLGIVLDSQPG